VTNQPDVEAELRQASTLISDFLWDKRRGHGAPRLPQDMSGKSSIRSLVTEVESVRRKLGALEVRAPSPFRSRISRLLARCDRLIDELRLG
jgi:hypothetical protein